MAYLKSISYVFMKILQRNLLPFASTDFILRGMEKGFHIGMILTDLQKEFDTLDTPFFYKKECIGFKKSVIKWLQSKISNKKFFVTP